MFRQEELVNSGSFCRFTNAIFVIECRLGEFKLLCQRENMKTATENIQKSINPNVAFTSKLYSVLTKEKGNCFYSPVSIQSAMGMCYFGSATMTEECLRDLLCLPDQIERTEAFYSELDKEINCEKQEYELVSSNTIWSQSGFELGEKWTQKVKDIIGGEVSVVDFKKPIDACDLINNHCGEVTKGKIPAIIKPDFINKDTRIVLTNAIYFKGQWKVEFNKNQTRQEKFYSESGVSSVDMMHRQGNILYFEHNDFQAVDLPYKGDDLSMMVILPRDPDCESNVDQNLEKVYSEAVAGLDFTEVNLNMPKFKVETEYSLKGKFQDMGAGLAFSNDADFSGISDKETLKISAIVHKAFVECDEKGTEAAAATAIGMVRTCSIPRPPKIFNANHPFTFFIRNKNSGKILFCGKVSNFD